MPDLQEEQLLEAIVREDEARKVRLAKLRDPKQLAEMCQLATRPEDAVEGVWFNFEEGSPHGDWHRFLREPTGRVKVILASRGTGKSTFGRMETTADYAADHNFSLFYGGETAVSVVKRALRLRTMLTRKALQGEYGVKPSAQDWGSRQFTIQRPIGPGDPPSLEVSSPDKPGTGAHYRRRLLDDASGERGFMSQKYAEAATRWYAAMQAQSLAITEEWIFGTPWPGKTIYRYIRDELEGGFTWEPYGRYTKIHRGEDYDVLMVGVYDEMGKTIWPFLDEKTLQRQKRKLNSKLLWVTQYLCEFVEDSELSFRGSWVLFEDPPVDANGELLLPLETYMSVDTATSTKGGNTSESALSVFSLNPYDAGYLRDMEIGQIPPKKMAARVVRMWRRWKPRRLYLESNASAAQMLEPAIQKEAKEKGIGRIPVRWIARESEKDYRILGFRDHVAEGQFHVCSTVDRKVIRRGKGTNLVGSLGLQFMNWVYGSGESFDGLDNLSDYYLSDKHGRRHCKPPLLPTPVAEKTLATYDAISKFLTKVYGKGGWAG